MACMCARRCLQVHECLGSLGAFQEAYARNRRLQLNSDLAPPASFLDGYQAFVGQLTGFFVIEDRVQRRCPALSGGAQVRVIIVFGPVWSLYCSVTNILP